MLSIGTFLVNLIIFGVSKTGTSVDSVVIIIVCAVAVGLLGVPLLGFFIFHLYLAVTGKTTREMIK